MMNICKIRQFPDYFYFVYDLSKADRGKWLNVWFRKAPYIQNGKLYPDNEYIILKECDKETSSHLYDRKFNPISIFINSYKDKNISKMKAMIHSIDDSSYGLWFKNSLKELELKRLLIMKWVSERKVINGEEFLNYCESLGGEDRDYN